MLCRSPSSVLAGDRVRWRGNKRWAHVLAVAIIDGETWVKLLKPWASQLQDTMWVPAASVRVVVQARPRAI